MNKPNTTTIAVGLSGALTALVVWIWGVFQPAHPIPTEIAGSLQVVVTVAVAHFWPEAQ